MILEGFIDSKLSGGNKRESPLSENLRNDLKYTDYLLRSS